MLENSDGELSVRSEESECDACCEIKRSNAFICRRYFFSLRILFFLFFLLKIKMKNEKIVDENLFSS